MLASICLVVLVGLFLLVLGYRFGESHALKQFIALSNACAWSLLRLPGVWSYELNRYGRTWWVRVEYAGPLAENEPALFDAAERIQRTAPYPVKFDYHVSIKPGSKD